jgi:hypothetical protein
MADGEHLIHYIDYVNFPQIFGEILKDDPEFGPEFRYTNTHPDAPAKTPCVVYNMIRMVPGIDGVEKYKPRFRDHVIYNEDGSVTEVWSQWMDCLFQFDCCATNRGEASDLAWRIRKKLKESVGLFQTLGAREVVFDEQLRDSTLPRVEGIETASVRFRAILEDVEFRSWPTIQEIRCRVFYPQTDEYESMVRGADPAAGDELNRKFISKILFVSDPSASGIARTEDYLPNVDFDTEYDIRTGKTKIIWTDPGKRPAAGAAYFVRYLYWTGFSRLKLPR